jgi:predicted DNA-binding transcriptional regulator AlpA/predicted XRE-type DNA-binding protein
MVPPTFAPRSGNVLTDLGIPQPDIEVAKADLAIRIQRLTERRRLTPDEAAALLNVPKPDLPALFQGRLATCSIDQLLRVLTWLGDDIELVIRPRLQRTKRGALRVLQAAAVEKPEDFEPIRVAPRRRASDAGKNMDVRPTATSSNKDDKQLLNKHAVEKMTSLDITTIYRKMAAGTFPQPVKVGRRRVAWRTADIMRWQQDLEIGTETIRSRTRRSRDESVRPSGSNRDRRQ